MRLYDLDPVEQQGLIDGPKIGNDSPVFDKTTIGEKFDKEKLKMLEF